MPDSSDRQPGEISGRIVVLSMFVFAVTATGALWTYWYYHSAPFVPLQVAIAEEFSGSSPRVDGGQRKMHKETSTLLWIIMRVEFDPEQDANQSLKTFHRVLELAREHLDLNPYEQLNVRLFRGDPEKTIHSRDLSVTLIAGVPNESSIEQTIGKGDAQGNG